LAKQEDADTLRIVGARRMALNMRVVQREERFSCVL